jgi:MFS family permease
MGYMTGFWFALVYTTFGVVVGFFADRTSRRNVLFCGAVLWSAFTAMCGMATNYWMMLAARVGVGVGEAAGAPPSYSIISDYFPAEKRGAALAIFSLGVPFGQALAVAFGSQIDIIWGWRAAFIGIGIAVLIGGAVVTESVFAIPGLGRLTVEAVLSRDFPVIQALILLFSTGYVLVNLLVDIGYAFLDPRIRY